MKMQSLLFKYFKMVTAENETQQSSECGGPPEHKALYNALVCPWSQPTSDSNSEADDLISFSDPFLGTYQRAEVPGHTDCPLLSLLFPQLSFRELRHIMAQCFLLYLLSPVFMNENLGTESQYH